MPKDHDTVLGFDSVGRTYKREKRVKESLIWQYWMQPCIIHIIYCVVVILITLNAYTLNRVKFFL